MASTTCGRCGAIAHMTAVSNLFISRNHPLHGVLEAAFRCENCNRLNLASEVIPDYSGGSQEQHVGAADERRWADAVWLPRHLETIEFEHVPEHIAGAATEATLCMSLGAYRAVGSLARAVIEATCKDKKAEGAKLYQRIEALHANDHVRKHTKDQAHEIRHFGNGMAHGDFADPVTKEEAEEVIELMREVLDEVYQSPARLAARKAARLAKKSETAGGQTS